MLFVEKNVYLWDYGDNAEMCMKSGVWKGKGACGTWMVWSSGGFSCGDPDQ